MGPRARMDQLQGRANALMAKAEWSLAEVREAVLLLIEMVRDGIKIKLIAEPGAMHEGENALTFIYRLFSEGGDLPVSVAVDLEYSEYPQAKSRFVGGPYDGKQDTLSEKQQQSKVIVLKDEETYWWNGHFFVWDGKLNVVQL